MFLNKGFYFLKGYVIIEVTGTESERFVNICLRRGIRLRDICRDSGGIRCRIAAADFKRLRPIAHKTRVRVHIAGKRSPILKIKREFKNYAFWISMCAAVALAVVSSQFIWSVEIVGNIDVSDEVIFAALEQNGIYAGAWSAGLPKSRELKRRLLNDIPELTWVWVHQKGAKFIVEVREADIAAAPVDTSEPCDIVAAKDGLIVKITATSGEVVTPAGNAVVKGDTIISGLEDLRFSPEKPAKYVFVHAAGTVLARTFYEKSGEYKLYDESRTPTGRAKSFYSVKLFSKVLNLFANTDTDFEDYDTEERVFDLNFCGYYTGISLMRTRLSEVSAVRTAVPEESVVERAKEELEERIAKKLSAGAVRIDEKVRYEKIDGDTLRVTLEAEFEENIAAESAVTLPDLTDQNTIQE